MRFFRHSILFIALSTVSSTLVIAHVANKQKQLTEKRSKRGSSEGQLKTVGITSIGTKIPSTHATRRAMPFTMPENGSIEGISIYHEPGSGNMVLGIYADDNGIPGELLGKTNETVVSNTKGWQTVDLTKVLRIGEGTTIWIAWLFEKNPGVYYETGAPGRYSAYNSAWNHQTDNMQGTFGPGDWADWQYSVYASYSIDNKTTNTGEKKPVYSRFTSSNWQKNIQKRLSESEEKEKAGESKLTLQSGRRIAPTDNDHDNDDAYLSASLDQPLAEIARVVNSNGIGAIGITKVKGNSISTHVSRRAMVYTMPENGTITSISTCHIGGTGNMEVGIYADNNGVPGKLLAKSGVTAVSGNTGWQMIALKKNIDAKQGERIWLSWIFEKNPGIYHTFSKNGRFSASGSSWDAKSNNMPDVFGSGTYGNYHYAIFANYIIGESAEATTPEINKNIKAKTAAPSSSSHSGFDVYFNPSTSKITVKVNDRLTEDCVIKIYDERWKLHMEVPVHQKKTDLDVSKLPGNQAYTVGLKENGKTSFKRFTKQ